MTLQYRVEGKVAIITFNRPPANAYNLAFFEQLLALINQAEDNGDVGCIIINSSSEKFFCAGADIKEFQANSTADNQLMVDKARETLAALDNCSKLVIAEIAGHALGGGLEIALACDLRFVAEGRYRFGLPEIKLGLMPGDGGTQRFTRLVGVAKALEWLASGDSFSVEQAEQMGLVNRVYPAEQLSQATLEYAQSVAKGPLLALKATKLAVYQGAALPLAEGLKVEQQLCDALYDTEDAKEGFLAFVEKREPLFQGK